MANVYQGPIPTRLVALSGLGRLPPGEKVRFLGCVTKYDISSGVLTIEHNYPPGCDHKAFVDVKLLLETLKSTDTRIGEWVNVIGYVMAAFPPRNHNLGHLENTTCIQAIVFWSAGSIKLEEYEKSLEEMLLVE